MNIENAQEAVDNWIKEHGVRYFNELTNMAQLTEEVGEVARIIARRYGEQSEKESDKNKDLGEELADVMFVVLCLANQTGINLQDAFDKKLDLKTKRDHDRHHNNKKLKYVLIYNHLKSFTLKLHLSAPENKTLNSAIKITGSKSESNRLLLLQALYPNIKIENLSNSDDAVVMRKGIKVSKGEVDIHHAGTAMRFLTTYFSCQDGKEVVLTGSKRMTERPIGVLVDALTSLGADITYLENSGYPPLHIKGKKITQQKVSLPANISSQYISSLLLTAPSLDNGLELELVGKITSVPYIKMTLALLTQIGVKNSFEGNTIKVESKKSVSDTTLVVESDWSSASYYYSIVAMSAVGTEISLSAYKKDSLQGDSVLADIYTDFGVETTFLDNKVILKKITDKETQEITKDLSNAPDIAQTIAVTTFGLGLGCHLTGLHTLKIKETDRLEALKTELTKLGASIEVTDKTLTIKSTSKINKDIAIDTYNDHRMGMAFAPLALKTTIFINDAGVVSKSYPDFWTDLKQLKFGIKEA